MENAASKPPRKRPLRRGIEKAFVALFILVAAIAAYFGLYVAKHSNQLDQYYLRLLSVAASNTEDAIDRLWINVKNAAEQEKSQEGIRSALQLIPALRLEPQWPAEVPKQCSREFGLGDSKGEIETSLGQVGNSTVLRLVASRTEFASHYAGVASLSTLLASILPTHEFDAVVLAREDGTVLLSMPEGPLEIVRLPIGSASKADNEGSKGDKKAAQEERASGTTIADVIIAERAYKIFAQPVRLPIEVCGSRINEAPRGDTSQATLETVWILAGLQEASGFRDRAMVISPSLVLAALILVIGTLLALPYLKIRYIGTSETLHTHDVLVLAIALLVATSIATFSLLDVHMNAGFKQSIDNNLKALGGEISRAFQEEIDCLDHQLRRLTQVRPRHNTNLLRDTTEKPLILGDYPFLEMAYWMAEDGAQTTKWTVRSKTTPTINVGTRRYFRNARDYQLSTGPLGEEGGRCGDPRRDLTDHESPTDANRSTRRGWYLESIRSRNTGEVGAVLSQRLASASSEVVECRQSDGDDISVAPDSDSNAPIVAAALSPLLSVIGPVLPPNYSFTVIDDRGEVLFHSDPSRNLRENFFDEVDRRNETRAAVLSRTESLVDVTYHDRSYRQYVQPLDGTMWALVTLHDNYNFRVMRGEIFTVALFLYVIYLFSFLASVGFLVLQRKRSQPGTSKDSFLIWLWPGPGRNDAYIRMLAICVLTTAAWLGLAIYGGGLLTVVGSGFLSLLAFWICYSLLRETAARERHATPVSKAVCWSWGGFLLSFRRGPRRPQERQISQSNNLFLAAVISLMAVLSILPPFAFYRAVDDEYITLSAKHDQLSLATSLGNRFSERIARYKKIQLAREYEKEIRERLLPPSGFLGEAWDIHGAATARRRDNAATDSGALGPVAFEQRAQPEVDLQGGVTEPIVNAVAGWLPGYTSQGDELRALAGPSDEHRWGWTKSRDRLPQQVSGVVREDQSTLAFRMKRYRRDLIFGQDVALPIQDAAWDLWLVSPLLGFQLRLWWWWIVVIAVGAALLLLTRSALRLVYLMEGPHPRFLSGKRFPDDKAFRHKLVLRSGEDRQKSDERIYSIDTSKWDSDATAESLAADAKRSSASVIRIEQLHAGIWKPELANRKLELLERLLAIGKDLEVHSDINPVHYFTMVSRDRGTAETDLDVARWSAVFETFAPSREPLEINRAAEQTEGLLAELKKQRDGLPSAEQALRHLAAECWPDQRLRAIAQWLARHPDLAELHESDDIINQVLDQAEAHYRILWAISGKDERILLHRVATQGFVSWRSSELLRRLVHRGLIRMAPNPELMNESFRRFVLRAELPEVFEGWTEEAGTSVWAALRSRIGLAILITLVFLFATQPQLFDQSLAFTTALAATAPALVKLISLLVLPRVSAGTGG